MAIGVVRALEVVDVEQDQAERLGGRGGDRLLERSLEAAAVGEPREGIRVGGALGGQASALELLVRHACRGKRLHQVVLGLPEHRDVGDDALGDDVTAGLAPAGPAIEQPAGGSVEARNAVLTAAGIARELAREDAGRHRPVVDVHRCEPLPRG